MRVVYLQQSLSMNGRGSLRGRKLADALRQGADGLTLGHVIWSAEKAATAVPLIRGDVISEVQLLELEPSVIYVEGGLFTDDAGGWRIDERLAGEFVNNGGTLIIADVDSNALRGGKLAYSAAATPSRATIREAIGRGEADPRRSARHDRERLAQTS